MKPEERDELLAAHALGVLPTPEAAEVEALVGSDAGTAERLAVYREIADSDPALLERMVRSSRRMRETGRRPFPVLRAAAIAVSLIVVAVLGGLVGIRIDGDGSAPVVVGRGGEWPPPPGGRSRTAAEVMIELRVWQNVEDPRDIWLQARPLTEYLRTGAPVETDRIAFPLDGDVGSLWLHHFHTFRDVAIAGTGLRLWQRYRDPGLIYVRACVTPCLQPEASGWYSGGWPWEAFHWSPLGKV